MEVGFESKWRVTSSLASDLVSIKSVLVRYGLAQEIPQSGCYFMGVIETLAHSLHA